MIRALWTAASGMVAQQLNVDTIANNLANVNTTGFKRMRVNFQDLPYEVVREADATLADQVLPQSIQVGHGVRPAGTYRHFSMGPLEQTDNPLDLAIQGEGFFKVLLPDGTEAYTRDGSFRLDARGRIVTADGFLLQVRGRGEVPADATEILISPEGTITARVPGEASPRSVGEIPLYRFRNPAALHNLGQNLYRATPEAGEPTETAPGSGGTGRLAQGFLERSNVQVVEEMINLIVAQRAYEMNSKAVQTADDMLAVANQLRR